ncbi:hypothetical protein [Skermanella stibiiresistens]|uniref:hypothetical protein n=1 Tax=Skermanella stibiiresistens TaxID=913326 RepID=UPI0004AF9462|nr:hypothetical protein [Skermanella stibiiresistens]
MGLTPNTWGSTGRGALRRILSPILTAIAIVYFLLDAVFLRVLRPFLDWIGRQPIFARIGAWIARLGPYPTLILCAIPVVIFEPLKPVGVYVMATGHPLMGACVIGGAELLKVVTLERLFRASREKLLTIGWFAWCYRHVTGWLDRIRALPAWRAAVSAWDRVKSGARRLLRRIRELA